MSEKKKETGKLVYDYKYPSNKMNSRFFALFINRGKFVVRFHPVKKSVFHWSLS